MTPTLPTSEPPAFLTDVLGPARPGPLLNSDEITRPYVTLTFAQSLDGKIAGKAGKQLILSGRESMIMTHWYAHMVRTSPHIINILMWNTQDENNA
jgi:2,5-diamino-6-(ribosylamino)-4(3H)-pyrimidinone 5'-phosphate reductase